MKGFSSTLLTAVMIVSVAASAAPLQKRDVVASDPDDAEQAAFRLNMDKLNRYGVANQALAQVMKDNKNQPQTPQDDQGDKDLAGMARNLEKRPGVAAAIQSSGLTTREYVVMGIVLFTTGAAVEMKKQGTITEYPASVSRENALFIEQNYDKVQSILRVLRDAARENAR